MASPLEVLDADITTLAVDAIVNAANAELAPGGGVCGAIHRAAGPELWDEYKTLNGCATGDAKLTGGHALTAKCVIHTVGPVWGGGENGEDQALENCYFNSLMLARANGLKSVAFPAISTGIYGFPPPRAAMIAVRTAHQVVSDDDHFERVIFCCFGAESTRLHEQALATLAP